MSNKINSSYFGYVGSTKDALLIIQSILNKQLNLIPRRPHERERLELIKSGNVFIFIEEHSGIKRWTDGISWSPSRILGRFLVYRELDKDLDSSTANGTNQSHPQSQLQSQQQPPSIGSHSHSNSISSINYGDSNYTTTTGGGMNGKLKKRKRSYDQFEINNIQHGFKDQGLIKKTLSITINLKKFNFSDKDERQTIHLISYYNANDVLNGKLVRPLEGNLKNVVIDKYLWDAIKESNLGGKIPIEDEAYYFLDNNYQLQNMSMLQHQQPVPRQPLQSQITSPSVPQQMLIPSVSAVPSVSSVPMQHYILPQLQVPQMPIKGSTPQLIPPPLFYNKNFMLPIPSNYDYHNNPNSTTNNQNTSTGNVGNTNTGTKDDEILNNLYNFNISNNLNSLNSLYHENQPQQQQVQNVGQNGQSQIQGGQGYYLPYYQYHDKRFKDELHLDDGHFISSYNQ